MRKLEKREMVDFQDRSMAEAELSAPTWWSHYHPQAALLHRRVVR